MALLKIDVEGHELRVLKGGINFIANLKPQVIQVESNIHGLFTGQTIHAISELLSGYSLYQITPFGIAPRDPNAFFANIFRYGNFCFVLKDNGD